MIIFNNNSKKYEKYKTHYNRIYKIINQRLKFRQFKGY